MSAKKTAQSSQEAVQAQYAAAEALGATLAEARQRLGFDQREVASRLGLNPVLIRRLEEGAFEELGAPVYARGYLTRYVRFLELPEQEMLDRHKQLGVSEVPPLQVTRTFKPQARMSDTGVRWFSYLLLFAVIGWVGWQGYEQVAQHLDEGDDSSFLSSSETFSNNDQALSLPQQGQATVSQAQPTQASEPDVSDNPTGSVVQEITPPSDQPTTADDEPAPAADLASVEPVTAPEPLDATPAITPEPPAETASNETAPAATTDLSAPTESVSASTQPEAAAPAVPPGPPQLTLEFTEDCWVEVKDANGERLVYGIMKANTVSIVSGPAPFSITLGNAVGVSAIKLNGRPIEQSLYRPERGTVIRFVVEPPQT